MSSRMFSSITWEAEGYGPAPDNSKRGVIDLNKYLRSGRSIDMLVLYFKVKSISRYVTVVCEKAMDNMNDLIHVVESLRETGYHVATVLDATPEDIFFMDLVDQEALLMSTDILVLKGRTMPVPPAKGFRDISSLFSHAALDNSFVVDVKDAMLHSRRFTSYIMRDIEWLALDQNDELVFVLKENADEYSFVNRFREESRA